MDHRIRQDRLLETYFLIFLIERSGSSRANIQLPVIGKIL
jgi:hypothetical protein